MYYTQVQNPVFKTEVYPVSVLAGGVYPEKEKKVLGYDFKDISFSNIEKKNDYEYNVDIILTVTPQYENEDTLTMPIFYNERISLRNTSKRFKIFLHYNKKNGEIITLSCREDLFF